jgi:hypothetical protein
MNLVGDRVNAHSSKFFGQAFISIYEPRLCFLIVVVMCADSTQIIPQWFLAAGEFL